MLTSQLIVTGMLAGLCWTIQLIVYPQFARVPGYAFAEYHDAHVRLITLLVAPLMLIELVLAVWLVAVAPSAITATLAALTAVVWASTGLVQVPLHDRLERQGIDLNVIGRLVATNWIRTAAWSARLGLLGAVSALHLEQW